MWMTLVTIFLIQVVYVTSLTTRMILTLRGYRYFAALLSMVDIMIYTIGLKLVLDSLDKTVNFVVYCVGYGVGILAGMKLEEKMALGYVSVQVIQNEPNTTLATILREKGYGITTLTGEGMGGLRMILSITVQRRNAPKLFQVIEHTDPQSFVIAHDITHYRGGFFTQRIGGLGNENHIDRN